MGKTTAIQWTDATWNPWRGCHKVSPGCAHCYMFREQLRYGKTPTSVVRAAPATFSAPLKWQEPMRVFVCSWSDFFIHEADTWRSDAWIIIRNTPHITYQILTKRPERIGTCLPPAWGLGWPNVWLGVSVESAEYLYRISHLREIPAAVRFISYEPALELVDFQAQLALGGIHWLISGGESGPVARPAMPWWFASVHEQCRKHGVAHFHKQHGGTRKIDGAYGGCAINGEVFHEYPVLTK